MIFIRRSVAVVVLVSGLVLPLNVVGQIFVGPWLPALVVWAGGTVAFSNALELSALTIGSIIAFVKWDAHKADGSAITAQIQLAPDAPLVTPPGWSPSSGSSGTGGVPSPNGGSANPPPGSSYPYNGVNYQTVEEACAAKLLDLTACFRGNGHVAGGYCYGNSVQSPTCGVETDVAVLLAPSVVTACPSGYELVGGVCNVSNANALVYPADNVCQIRRIGNSYQFDERDPDCASHGADIQIDGGQVFGVGSDGKTVRIAINPSSGETDITRVTPQPTGPSRTEITRLGAPVPSAAGPGATGVPVTGKSVGTSPGSGTLGGSPNIDTSGLNQEATQRAVKANLDQIKSDVTALKQGLDASGVSDDVKNLTVAKEAFDTASAARVSQLGNVTQVTSVGLGLSITWPTSGCSDPSFDILGHGNLVVPMCVRRDDVQAAMNWVVGVLTAFTIFGIGIGALRR